MARNKELKIDGYSIYIDQLNQLDTNARSHDAGSNKAINWTVQQMEYAMKPVISILNSLRSAFEDTIPDDMELSMQFEISLKGETPILKIVSAESKAQIAVKFLWKNNNQES